jgi:hypothetical protein
MPAPDTRVRAISCSSQTSEMARIVTQAILIDRFRSRLKAQMYPIEIVF